MNGLNKKLEVQKRVIQEAKAHYEKMVQEHGEGSKQADKAARSYNNEVASLRNLERHVNQTKKELEKLRDEQRIANTNFGKLSSRLTDVSGKMSKVGDSMQNAGNGMTSSFGIATAAVGGGLALATKKAMDFESQISSMKSVMSPAEAKQFGGQLEKLAITMGAKTKYSAIEAAQGIEELLKAGVSVKDVINGGLKGALSLATAGELELADAAEIASTALNAFKKDGISVTRAADLLAGAANASATDVGELKYGLSMVSAVASGVGLSFEDTTTALATFAQNGLKGSDAGTSLKTMLLNLSPSTDAQTEAFDALGLATYNTAAGYKFLIDRGIKPAGRSAEDIKKGLQQLAREELGAGATKAKLAKEYGKLAKQSGFASSAFYDENGKLKSMSQIAGRLREALSGLNDEQRQNYLRTMFGTDAIRAANILYEEGADGIKNMNKEMNKIKAADVAKQKLNNFKGTIEELKGSLETAGISIGAALIPALQGLTKVLQKAVDWFNNLSPGMQKTIAITGAVITVLLGLAAAFGVILTVAGGAITGISTVAGAFGNLAKSISTAGGLLKWLGSGFTFLTGPVGLTIGAIALLVTGFVIAYKKSETFRAIVNKVKDAFVTAYQKIKTFLTTNKTLLAFIDSVKNGFNTIKGAVSKALGAVVTFIKGKFKEIKSFWDSNGQQILAAFRNIFNGIMLVVGPVLKAIWATIKFILPAIKGLFKITFTIILTIIKSVWNNIKGIITGALNVIMGIVKIFSGLFTGDFRKMWEGIKQVFFGAIQFVWNYINLLFVGRILKAGKFLFSGMKSVVSAGWNGIKSIFSTVIKWIVNFVKNSWTNLKNVTSSVFGAIKKFFSTIWNGIKSIFKSLISSIVSFVKNRWSSIKNATTSVFSAVKKFLTSIWSGIKNSIGNLVGKLKDGVISAWGTLKSKTVSIFSGIKTTLKNLWEDIVDGAKALPGKIGKGIKSMAKKAWEGAKYMAGKLIDGISKGVNGVIDGVKWVLVKIGADELADKLHPWKPKKYAKGTDGHPGGPAIVGDGGGEELIRTPDGRTFLSPATDTLVNLPRGTQVLPHKETKALLNMFPAYKTGVGKKIKEAAGEVLEAGKRGAMTVGRGIKTGAIAVKDLTLDVWDYASNPSKLLNLILKKTGIAIPKIGGLYTDIAKGAFSFVKNKAISFLKKQFEVFTSVEGGFGPPFIKSSGYGPRDGDFHWGVDYAAPAGTPIPALAGGNVIFSDYGQRGSGYGGYGNAVAIQGLNGLIYLYGHNSKNLVKKGQSVKPGDIIGLVGSTGDSTGPHVHFEIRQPDGTKINPEQFLQSKGGGKVSGSLRTWIKAGMARAGVSGSNWFDGLAWIINKESGGNPSAVGAPTSTGRAKGLMQLKDFNIQGDPFDPVNNIYWGIRYIKGRYKSIGRALSWWKKHHWYATGGLINNSGLYALAEDGWPEFVIPTNPARRTDAMKLLALAGKTIGNKRPHQLPSADYSGSDNNLRDVVNRQDQQIALMQKQIDLLTQLLLKDNSVYISTKQIYDANKKEKDKKDRLRNIFKGVPAT
ncbi:phage tail tape measure protein [Fictibacillus sp. Mic-4]|uniref:phage tail tape measure protein n=1 Tax=Fictibacillus sp. Mic-4 TaxID=3132826 RepID=UPI003CEF3716